MRWFGLGLTFLKTGGHSFVEMREYMWVRILRRRTSMVAQMVKNLPAMQKTWVRSLGQEDPLEKGMATHSSILGWRIPWM